MWLVAILPCFLYGSLLVQGLSLIQKPNPEALLNSEQVITFWGYPCQKFFVVTEDNYIIQLFRIPHGINDTSTGPRPAVLLHHGLLMDASAYYQNPPNSSLAFILADNGYDVWLGNSRGNTWSRNHTYLSPLSEEFWDFSFDEMAKYDLPACIDFILQKTGQQQLYYVGHSQGTTIGFIAFSTNQKLASKVKQFFALAPVATVKYAKSLLAQLAVLPEIAIKAAVGNRWFAEKSVLASRAVAEFCSQDPFKPFCTSILFLIYGFDEKNMNMSRVDVYASNAPSGTSVKNMLHWKQAVNSGNFQAYDYGFFRNLMEYNQATPPKYNVSAMTVPTAIWCGGNDWLATPEDVKELIPKIQHLTYFQNVSYWNHLDPLVGLDARRILYDKMLILMQENP